MDFTIKSIKEELESKGLLDDADRQVLTAMMSLSDVVSQLMGEGTPHELKPEVKRLVAKLSLYGGGLLEDDDSMLGAVYDLSSYGSIGRGLIRSIECLFDCVCNASAAYAALKNGGPESKARRGAVREQYQAMKDQIALLAVASAQHG